MIRFVARSAPWWCAALHLLAAAGTLVLLRGGSEAVADMGKRALWLEANRAQWRAGWVLWMIAAASLAAFYAWWASRIRGPWPLAAMGIAGLGLVCDFTGEAIFIGWVPAPDSALYRVASLLTGGAGNGLYTTAGIILTLVTPDLPPLLRGWAWLVWASGISLTVATVIASPAGMVFSSAALMILFIPWVVAVGMRLR